MVGFLEQIERIQQALASAHVFGDPVERDGVLILPVLRVRGGGGGGEGSRTPASGRGSEESVDSGSGSGSGSGGGFGLDAHPVGVYVLQDGRVRWEPAFDLTRIALAGMATWVVALVLIRSMVRVRAGA